MFSPRMRQIRLYPHLLSLILFVSSLLTGSVHAQPQPQGALAGRNILILNAYESNVPAFEKTDRGLSAALQSGGIGTRNQFYEHLDLVRNPGPENRRLVVELMRQRYDRRKIDFIITLYPEALKFLLDEGQAIFSDAPVLALYLPQGFELPITRRRIIPHLVVPDLKRTIEIALKLVPTARRIYVVGGTHPMDRWLENIARKDFKTWEGLLEFRYLSDLPLEEILATVSNAPSDSIVFVNAFGKDAAGKYQTTVDVSQRLARVSKAPVFGFLDTLLGNGIVGGSLLSFEYIGTRAGEMALDILRGTRYAENTPIVLEVPQLDMFDWRRLRHWKLRESALPAGSIIVNREFSLWDLKYYAIGVLALILVQSLLIAGLLLQRRHRRSAEESLGQKTEELNQFFNVSLDLLCIAKTDGYFLRLNPIWEKVLGYTRDELMSKRFTDFVHPDDVRSTTEAVTTLASQKAVTYFMNRYRCKDGTYRWLEWSAAPTGNLIYAAARDVTERRQDRLEIEERLRFEALISNLSAAFVNLPPDEVDSEINKGLRAITEFFDADRCSIGLFSKDRTQLTLAFEYHSAEIEPAAESMSKEQFPWYMEQLIRGNPVVINRVDDLPTEAEKERQLCLLKNMKSVLSIPLVSAGKTLGSCALVSARGERVWPEVYIPRLRLLGEILVNAVERKQDRLQLEERFQEIENLKQRLEKENIYLQEEVKLLAEHAEIVGQSLAMKRILAQAEQVAQTDSTVLIQGETGTGKELLTRAIHSMSLRKDRPLVTVNCASLPPTLIESELFGRERGAYTGALTKMVGRFEVADGSTLFLDEIGELPFELQSKLLRVLEEGKFERLGSTKTLHVNVRIIAATNRDIAQDVKEGKFRKDLFYRLNVFPIVIPPLRERPEDIPLLVWSFVREFQKNMGKRVDNIPKKSMEALQSYSWPGNVRELRNVIERAIIVSSSTTLNVPIPSVAAADVPNDRNLEDIERKHIVSALEKAGWRVTGNGGAAEALGLKRTTLQSKMKKLGIKRPNT
jgi:formate hydrogenlyase transcriptional activator